jgi:HK97 family phage portal protein
MPLLRGLIDGLLARDGATSTLNNPSQDLYAALTGALEFGGPVNAGVTVNSETAMRQITVFRCVTLLAQSIAYLPLGVYVQGGSKRTPVRTARDSFIWGAPNPEMRRQNFWETVLGCAILTGNGYVYKVRDGLGQIVELWPLDPRRVDVRREGAYKVFYVDGERCYGPHRPVGAEDEIGHLPGFSRDGLRGLNPIAQAREALGLAIAAEEYGARFFAQGSTVAGILSYKEPLEDVDANRAARQWQRLHSGARNAHKIAVLDNGATWQQVGSPPATPSSWRRANSSAARSRCSSASRPT